MVHEAHASNAWITDLLWSSSDHCFLTCCISIDISVRLSTELAKRTTEPWEGSPDDPPFNAPPFWTPAITPCTPTGHWTLHPSWHKFSKHRPSPLFLALLVFSDTWCQSEEKKGVKPSVIDLKICSLSFPFKLRRDILERPLLKCKSDTHNKTQVSCLLNHATFLHRGRFKIKTKKWKCQNVSKTSKSEKIVKSDKNFVRFC